jgi:thymidylate synthase
MEMVWFLEGKGDLNFIAKFLPRMAEYSDDGIGFNAHYGQRIRYPDDQLKLVIKHLLNDPASRSAVVQIWDKADLNKVTRDKACNMQLVFRMVGGKLDMTVYNRSNDAIWGGISGANITNLFVFQAYVAAGLCVNIGKQYVASNNLHLYLDNPKTKLLLDHYHNPDPKFVRDLMQEEPLKSKLIRCNEFHTLDSEIKQFMAIERLGKVHPSYQTDFIRVAEQIASVHHWYRQGNLIAARDLAKTIPAPDWREACTAWLTRRWKKQMNIK